ncbi:Vps54-domain-containing protein [Cutaneotrichosporon oleaginosum]|uniref:Vps54-domain-containing protein n=1 Tax=Cutaneotrichosporon oleaginosum TaxID=879819 RepID=A0A0J0XWP8_9TREE|nr:Vps54-domain-containing protein [Cutaneotrichosporon oleaginosum]KLT45495.1 Vps54-domain-containing protein [Cutaneotrichosporon oleaginosum]TXT14550.1 hypothetical protein COLE_00743 [Cutaneotrichosporon oleaginosum]
MSKPAPQGLSAPAVGSSTAAAATSGSTPVPSSPPASESFFSEFDGTASVMDTSYGDAAAWEAPADASSLNIVSWKLGVDAHVDDGVGKRGFNAISTVLNHPTKRANPLRGSRKPLPPLGAPPLLPKPQPPSFYDGYLKSIAPLYEQFVQSQAAAASSSGNSANGAPELDIKVQTPKEDLPSLNAIPNVFFDSAFDIANPSTWAEIMDSAEPFKGKTHDAAVQETLSTHLDNLERHLVHEITLRSSSFFSALGNLQDLNSESSSCLSRITNLKTALGDIGGKQARKGLEIIDAQARLNSLRVTESGVKRVAELDEMIRLAKNLADAGDWAGALGCVEDVMRWWERNGTQALEGEGEDRHLPLTTLPALSYLPTSIAVLTANIAGQLETALQAVLQSILSEAEHTEFDSDELRTTVGPMLGGLIRCGKTDTLAGVWREAVTTSIRDGLRRHLPVPQGEEDDVGNRGTESSGQGLAQKLRAMSHSEFTELCKKMYSSMLSRIKLIEKMGEEMSSMLADNRTLTALSLTPTSDGPQLAPRTPEGIKFEPGDVLTSACELANTRASIIVSARSEQHAMLSLSDFLEIFNETMEFVSASEALAKRVLGTLRGAIQAQARAFLQAYHQQRLTRSARLVEEETWVQVDVPSATQHAADLLVEAAVSDPGECFVPPRDANGSSNGESSGTTKLISIEDKTFCVVKATSESLQLLSEYLAIVINLELVATDVMTRIIEFLRSFNSRICQLVLGAGAMRSAGLKNITAKHLALASQSLSVIIALIPYVREFIRRHVNPRQAVMLVEFDKLKRDYQDHQEEIHAKLVAIMSDRLAVHCGELREIDWEQPSPRDAPHSYALMLVKETATLHKVLSKYLAHATVEAVMSQVIAAYVSRLGDEYTKVELKSEDAKKRMQQDAAIIAARLAPLAESGSSAASLEALVREKSLPRRDVGAAMRGLLRKSSNGPDGPEPAATPLSNGDEEGLIVEKRSSSESKEGKSEEGKEASGDGAEDKAANSSPSRGWREVGDDEGTPASPSPPLTSKSPVDEGKSEGKSEETEAEEAGVSDDPPPLPSKPASRPASPVKPEPEVERKTSPPPPSPPLPPEKDAPPATPAKDSQATETPTEEVSEARSDTPETAKDAPSTPAKDVPAPAITPADAEDTPSPATDASATA